MIQAALTPVERGILFILMAHSQALTQTDLRKAHGLSVKKTHRLKLEDRGLIQAASKRPFTLALTQKGRAWVEAELSAPKQKGALGLGPLCTVLGAIDELSKRAGQPLEDRQALNGSGASPAQKSANRSGLRPTNCLRAPCRTFPYFRRLCRV